MNISFYSDVNYLINSGIFLSKNKSINKVDNKEQLSKSSNASAISSPSFTLPLKLLSSVRNYEVRGHPWNMIAVCINEKKPEEILMVMSYNDYNYIYLSLLIANYIIRLINVVKFSYF
jgi:hypothetical protein